ncbi:MAG: artM 1 [Mycobacterium sp.]|jgi:peptide/nickel transport system ATP-binding protein|nr:artM 1 [Mycobacterium sp.]
MTALLEAEAIAVTFSGRRVLDDISLTVRPGEIVGVTGPSGCGKTTLLRVLAGVHTPDTGVVRYAGTSRRTPGFLGMLAQHPRLVCNPRWTLRDVISEPARIRATSADVVATSARAGLDTSLLDRFPAQVSDGQLQRACIARTLTALPRVLLCDEPTAMLDPIAAGDVVALLRQIAAEGTGIVLVSHNPRVVGALAGGVLELTAP